jgi:hypothetical protein
MRAFKLPACVCPYAFNIKLLGLIFDVALKMPSKWHTLPLAKEVRKISVVSKLL